LICVLRTEQFSEGNTSLQLYSRPCTASRHQPSDQCLAAHYRYVGKHPRICLAVAWTRDVW